MEAYFAAQTPFAGAHHYNKAGNAFPSSFDHHNAFPSTFGGNHFEANWPSMMNSFEGARFPMNFEGARFPMNSFESRFPMNFEGARFPMSWSPSMNFEGARYPTSWPSTFGGNHHFGGNHFEANWPSTFGAHHNTPSWFNNFWAEKTMARHYLPTEVRDVAFRPASMAEYLSFANPIHIHPVDGSRMLHLCFDVKGFKPEEVTVSVSIKERCFTVECKHDVKEKEHAVTRSYTRKFVLPAEYCVDLTKVEKELKSCFTHDGLLIIEAVLPRMTAEELKVFREKALTLATRYETAPLFAHHGVHGAHHHHHACSVPIKTVA